MAPDGFKSSAEIQKNEAQAKSIKQEKAKAEAKKREEEAKQEEQERKEIDTAMAIFDALPPEIQTEIDEVATHGFKESGEEVRRMLIAAEVEKRQANGELIL